MTNLPSVLRQLAKRTNDGVLRGPAFDAADRIEALEAEIAQMKEERDEWRDVVCWTDDGEKTVFDWHAGGGHPEGEFALIGLRREMPDGTVLNRAYRATGPWAPLQLQEAKP